MLVSPTKSVDLCFSVSCRWMVIHLTVVVNYRFFFSYPTFVVVKDNNSFFHSFVDMVSHPTSALPMELSDRAGSSSRIITANLENMKECYYFSSSITLRLPRPGKNIMNPLLSEVRMRITFEVSVYLSLPRFLSIFWIYLTLRVTNACVVMWACMGDYLL